MKLIIIISFFLVTIERPRTRTEVHRVQTIQQVDSLYQKLSIGNPSEILKNSVFVEIRTEKFSFYAEKKTKK